jgi:hypothetical protein
MSKNAFGDPTVNEPVDRKQIDVSDASTVRQHQVSVAVDGVGIAGTAVEKARSIECTKGIHRQAVNLRT